MDQATTELILKLHIQDADDAIEEELDKNSEQQTDTHLSLVEIRRELQETLMCMEDRRLAFQIGHDDQADRTLVARYLEEERSAANDHELACRLAGTTISQADRDKTEHAIEDTASVLSAADDYASLTEFDFERSTVSGLSFMDHNEFCGTTTTPSSKIKGKGRADIYVRCCICQDSKPLADTVELSCDREHIYCHECLVDHFESSMTDTELFPPRCCRQPIPLGLVKTFFSQELITRFEEKTLELSTPNPTYCSQPTCSKFIPPKTIHGDVACCVACSALTCVTCKALFHDGLCPDNPNVQALLSAARENGWQKCHNCRNLVELSRGCNHITCRCGAEFCYLCGAPWKTCPCDQWVEERLYEEGFQQAARDQPWHVPPLRADVEQAVRNLRENHECDHRRWRHLPRCHGHNTTCEMCPRQPRGGLEFINECRQCRLRVCWRCINNRLR